MEAHYVEYVAQKARKKAEKRRIVEKEKIKIKLEYLQQLQDEVLAENTILLEDTKRSQIMKSKHKEVTPGDNRKCWPFKKAKEKQPARYHRDIISELKMMDLVSILFYFILFYFLLGFIVDHKTKKTKHDTITGHMTRSHMSHAHMT